MIVRDLILGLLSSAEAWALRTLIRRNLPLGSKSGAVLWVEGQSGISSEMVMLMDLERFDYNVVNLPGSLFLSGDYAAPTARTTFNADVKHTVIWTRL